MSQLFDSEPAAPGLEQPGSEQYTLAVAGEGAFWDDFTAQRLRRGEIPGSIDWRLTFTQFRYNHGWRPLCLGPQGVNFRLPEIRYVLTTAAPQPGLRVLDLGCGAGWLSLELARRGAHVTALDISETNLALARYMAETNTRNFPFLYQNFVGLPCILDDFGSVEYAYADLNTVSLPAGEYDAVVVWDSLHHVRDLERLLEEVRRALKPEGVFVGMDHAYATTRTEAFNRTVLPLLDDFYAWVSRDDPRWLYDLVNTLGRERDWTASPVDYDATPVPGFAPFVETLLSEMLAIVEGQSGGQRKAIESSVEASQDDESPFEDVSAERVMHVLLEEFGAREFRTVCPFVQPERHVPHYRHEAERIFQSYLSSAIITAGERAIAHKQADGQWFLFNLTPERPSSKEQLEMLPDRGLDSSQTYISALETMSKEQKAALDKHIRNLQASLQEQSVHILHQRRVLDERLTYTGTLEADLARKDAALSDLERRYVQLERELIAARAPRLPWKRRKR